MRIYKVDLWHEWGDVADEEVYCKTMKLAKKEAKRLRKSAKKGWYSPLPKGARWKKEKVRLSDGQRETRWTAVAKIHFRKTKKKMVLAPQGGEMTVTIHSIPVKVK